MNDYRSFFLKEKPVKALMVIGNSGNETYCSEVSEEIDSTYAHTVKLISRMDELGLIETRRSGRKKMVSLSEEGEKQAGIFRSLLKHYGDYDEGKGPELGEKGAFSK